MQKSQRALWIVIVAILAAMIVHPADAKPRKHHHQRLSSATVVCDHRGCSDVKSGSAPVARHAPALSVSSNAHGCPIALSCGCRLSLKLFGRVITTPNLKMALTWAKVFPRTSPAPGMVAVGHRKGGGHVFELLSHIAGDVWLVYDPNSGGHKDHVHERSIAGKIIVNPNAMRVAAR